MQTEPNRFNTKVKQEAPQLKFRIHSAAKGTSQPKVTKKANKRMSTWVDIKSFDAGQNEEPVKLLRKSHVPKVIYIRNTSDVVRQLSSIGSKTYLSSHKSPYGDALAIRALSNNECIQLWEAVKEDNLDRTCPAGKGGPDVFICADEDLGLAFKTIAEPETVDPKVRAQEALRQRASRKISQVQQAKPKVLVSIMGRSKDGRALLSQEEREQKVADWDKWVQEHFQDIIDALQKTNEAPEAPVKSGKDDASEAQRAEALLYAEPTLSMSEIVFTEAQLRAQQVGNTKAIAKRNEAIAAKLKATVPVEAGEPGASICSLTPSRSVNKKSGDDLKDVKEAKRPSKQQRQAARAAPPGATLSLKSQIMEQIFDIQEDAFGTNEEEQKQNNQLERRASIKQGPQARLRGALSEVRRFNSTIKSQPRNFSSSTRHSQAIENNDFTFQNRDQGRKQAAPLADPDQPDYQDMYYEQLQINCGNQLIGDLGQTRSLYRSQRGKIPCIQPALKDKYRRLSAAYTAKLAATLEQLNHPVLSEQEHAHAIGKYRDRVTGEDKSQYGRLREMHQKHIKAYCAEIHNDQKEKLGAHTRCEPPNDKIVVQHTPQAEVLERYVGEARVNNLGVGVEVVYRVESSPVNRNQTAKIIDIQATAKNPDDMVLKKTKLNYDGACRHIKRQELASEMSKFTRGMSATKRSLRTRIRHDREATAQVHQSIKTGRQHFPTSAHDEDEAASSDALVQREEFELYMHEASELPEGAACTLSQQPALSPLERASYAEAVSRNAGRASNTQNSISQQDQAALGGSIDKKPPSGSYGHRGSRADDMSTRFDDKLSSAAGTQRNFKQSKENFNRTLISQSSMNKTILPRQTSALASDQFRYQGGSKHASMHARFGARNQQKISQRFLRGGASLLTNNFVELGDGQNHHKVGTLSNLDADVNLKDEDGENSGRDYNAFSFRQAHGGGREAEMASLPTFTGESQLQVHESSELAHFSRRLDGVAGSAYRAQRPQTGVRRPADDIRAKPAIRSRVRPQTGVKRQTQF